MPSPALSRNCKWGASPSPSGGDRRGDVTGAMGPGKARWARRATSQETDRGARDRHPLAEEECQMKRQGAWCMLAMLLFGVESLGAQETAPPTTVPAPTTAPAPAQTRPESPASEIRRAEP